ncbi:hypothetical protein FB382_004276 [Nocardioides ginsengisegetis]|uniref:DnaJ homologue subfamily C member 28 conserved domain-containing protein n=1 Tax=Nocardioides ginsengisegetis TaxID=661491 RepID=A0A7W3PBU7_9ACTN|nr:hypothetical protein [Nocardioides ginsengisegetis]
MTDQPDRQTDPLPEKDERTGRSAAAARMHNQASWVDQQIRVAMAKGEFDNLPGAGKPITDLGPTHDPDWWLKKLVEREHIAVLPASLQLRKDDAELDALLDRLNVEAEVRREVEEFNARVIAARYRPPEGPPLITMPRDVDSTVAGWRQRRTARLAAHRATPAPTPAPVAESPKRCWFRRPR